MTGDTERILRGYIRLFDDLIPFLDRLAEAAGDFDVADEARRLSGRSRGLQKRARGLATLGGGVGTEETE